MVRFPRASSIFVAVSLALLTASGCALSGPSEEFLPEQVRYAVYWYDDAGCSGHPVAGSPCTPSSALRLDLCPDGTGLLQVDDIVYGISYRVKHRTVVVTKGDQPTRSFILSADGSTLTSEPGGLALTRYPYSGQACQV